MAVSTETTLGKLCKRSHDHEGTGKSLRYAKGSRTCIACHREMVRRRASSGAAYLGPLCKRGHEHEDTGMSLRRRDGHCLACGRAQHDQRRKKDPKFALHYHLKRHFSMSVADYEQMLRDQDGVCAICRRAERFRGRLCVDHDHETGRVRGLLCLLCNSALGGFRDDVGLLLAAVHYLQGRVSNDFD
jgi:hypothetical protein